MERLIVKMVPGKETVHKIVYKSENPTEPITSIYIAREAIKGSAPKAIAIIVEEWTEADHKD